MNLDSVLRDHGCRVTRPRHVVWQVLTTADEHLSAQEIAEQVRRRDPGINVSSVYRTLALFAELDLVRESRLGDDASTWEPAHGDAVIHLVCDHCGAVRHHDTATVETLRRRLARDAGFVADHIDVRVSGRCEACNARVGTAAPVG